MAFLSDNLFKQIGEGIAADPSLATKIKGVYCFVITAGPGGATKEWTIDLKSGSGSLTQGKGTKPDVTLTVSDADFVALSEGKANAQQLFMQGKIKMQGNMGLAMKLEQVIKSKKPAGAAPVPAAAAAPAAPAAAAFKSDALFNEIGDGVASDPTLVKKVNGIYCFAITDGPNGAKKEWTVDLKNGNGAVRAGKPEKADATITISDEAFMNLAEGKANPQQLFMQGKIKLTGNMGLAMKLDQVIKAKKPAAKL